jgi:penicillin-binding protein 2
MKFSFKQLFRTKEHVSFDLDETLLDAHNLPAFKQEQFEGVIEKPISQRVFMGVGLFFLIFLFVFISKLFSLQVLNGNNFSLRAASNSLEHSLVFAERGVLLDRNGIELAWNEETRSYIQKDGFGHLLGYINLPREDEVKDKKIYAEERVGRDGVERMFDSQLRGTPGVKIVEVDVNNKVQSESVFEPAVGGESVTLSIDSRIEEELYKLIKQVSVDRGFTGGAGVLMDVHTGELIAMTSYPEYDPSAFLDPEKRKKYFALYKRSP